MNWPSRIRAAHVCKYIDIRGGLSHKPGSNFRSRSPRQNQSSKPLANIEIRQINDDDDDDDDDDDNDDDDDDDDDD